MTDRVPSAAAELPAAQDVAAAEPDLASSAARGASITISAQVVRFVLQIVSLIALARLLTPHDFGIVAMVTPIAGAATILRDFGLSSIQAKSVSHAEKSNLFWVNVAVGAGCAGVLALSSPLFDRLYSQSGLTPIVLALTGVLLISGVNTQFSAELSRELRFKAMAAADVMAQAGGIIVAIALAASGTGYWAIVGQQLAVAALTLALNMRSCQWRPGAYRRSVSVTRFFRFSGGVLGVHLMSYVTENVDNVAIGISSGATALGIYSRAYQLLMTPLNQINAPLTRVVLPVLSRVQDDDDTYNRYLHRAQLVGCYLTASVFTVSAGLAYPLTEVLFGHRWIAVAPIFALLAVGGVFRSIAQIAYWAYLSRGKAAAQLKLYFAIRPIMIAIIVGGVPWGAQGVAAGGSIAYFGYWVASLWHVSRAARVDGRSLFRTAFRSVVLVSAPAGLAAWAATFVVEAPILQLLLGVVLAGLSLFVSIVSSETVRNDAQFIYRFAVRSLGRKAELPRHRATLSATR